MYHSDFDTAVYEERKLFLFQVYIKTKWELSIQRLQDILPTYYTTLIMNTQTKQEAHLNLNKV